MKQHTGTRIIKEDDETVHDKIPKRRLVSLSCIVKTQVANDELESNMDFLLQQIKMRKEKVEE